jgi:hypothetical protein
MMVAMTILVLLGGMIAEMIDLAGRLTNASRRPMDATYEARVTFDRMAADLAAMFQRSDMVYVFKNVPPGESASQDPNQVSAATSTADLMRFVSQVQAPDMTGADNEENRSVSIVGYRMGTDKVTEKPVLQRGARAVYWNKLGAGGSTTRGDVFFGMQSSGTGPNAYFWPVELPTVEDDELWNTVANGVFRIEIGFQLGKDYADPDNPTQKWASGTILPTPPLRSWQINDTGATKKVVDITKIGSIVVAIGVVDRRTWEQTKLEELQQLAEALPPLPTSVTGYGQVPLESWLPVVRPSDGSTAFRNASSVPTPVRNAARVYQRFFTVKQ